MNEGLAPDLLEFATAVEIRSPTAFAIGELDYAVGASATLVEAMKAPLYQFYSRGPAPAPGWGFDPALARRFLEALSEANHGSGTFEPGWEMVAVDEDGRVGARKDGLTLWVEPPEFLPFEGAYRPGARGRLRIGKELRELVPGFYMAIGDAPEAEPAERRAVVRVYWHIAAEAAAPLMAALTAGLNAIGVPFRFKTVAYPRGYGRADSAVLYLARPEVARAWPIVLETYERVAPHVAVAVPRLTRAAAPGLGLADDPTNGESFGQHRCRIIAEALWTAFQEGRSSAGDRAEVLASTFAQMGMDPRRPYLGPGAQGDYVLPSSADAPARARCGP
jgi:hypothetical protein